MSNEINIVDITDEDIEKLADELYAEGGALYYLRELRGLGYESN